MEARTKTGRYCNLEFKSLNKYDNDHQNALYGSSDGKTNKSYPTISFKYIVSLFLFRTLMM